MYSLLFKISEEGTSNYVHHYLALVFIACQKLKKTYCFSISIGDLLLNQYSGQITELRKMNGSVSPVISFPNQSRMILGNEFLTTAKYRFNTIRNIVNAITIINNNILVLSISGITKEQIISIDSHIKHINQYYGCFKVDLKHPMHYALLVNSLFRPYIIENGLLYYKEDNWDPGAFRPDLGDNLENENYILPLSEEDFDRKFKNEPHPTEVIGNERIESIRNQNQTLFSKIIKNCGKIKNLSKAILFFMKTQNFLLIISLLKKKNCENIFSVKNTQTGDIKRESLNKH